MALHHHLEHLNRLKLRIIDTTLFFVAITSALLAYIQSSFLKELIGEQYVGVFFSTAYFLTLVATFCFPSFIKKRGKRFTILILLSAIIAILLALILAPTPIKLLALLFYEVTLTLIGITLDIFLEFYSKDKLTGRIRGAAYTAVNIGWVLTAAITGFLASQFGFSILFLIGALILVPFIGIFILFFRHEQDVFNHQPPIRLTLKKIFHTSNLWKIFCVSFLLNFFYAVMVLFTPLHLRNIGFEWHEILPMFSVMLLPFVLLQYPAGYLADRFLGEKEILTVGTIILSGATASLYFLSAPIIWQWTALLFTTRIGAALIEIMRDSFFYKQIDFRDIHIISFFRNTGPLAYIIAPLFATLVLNFAPFSALFLVVGAISLLGLIPILSLKDTK
jgi:MFS family permease